MRIAPVWECRECPFFDAPSKDNRKYNHRNEIGISEYDGYCHHATQMDSKGYPRRIEGLSAGQIADWCELEVAKSDYATAYASS